MGSVVLNKSSEHNGAGALPGGNPAEWSGLRVRATELDCAFESLSLDDRLLGMRREVRGKIIFTTSFGLEDQMILDSLRRLQVDVDIVTLDTGRLFAETYALWAESEQRYGIRIRAVYPQHDAVEALIAAHGINGFYDSSEARKACCHARKVEPLNRALAGAAAWVTGSGPVNPIPAARLGWSTSIGTAASSSSIRCPIGRATLCCSLRARGIFRSIRCMPRASPPSAAHLARVQSSQTSPSAQAVGGGSKIRKRNAVYTNAAGRRAIPVRCERKPPVLRGACSLGHGRFFDPQWPDLKSAVTLTYASARRSPMSRSSAAWSASNCAEGPEWIMRPRSMTIAACVNDKAMSACCSTR